MPQDEQTRWLNDALAGVKRSAFFMGKAMVRKRWSFPLQLAGSCLLCFSLSQRRTRSRLDSRFGFNEEKQDRCPGWKRKEHTEEKSERERER